MCLADPRFLRCPESAYGVDPNVQLMVTATHGRRPYVFANCYPRWSIENDAPRALPVLYGCRAPRMSVATSVTPTCSSNERRCPKNTVLSGSDLIRSDSAENASYQSPALA